MALVLSKQVDTGVTGDYFRVISCSVDLSHNTASVDVALYLNAANRDSGRSPIEISSYLWRDAANPFTVEALEIKSIIAIAYSKLKSLPEYQGAQDA